MTLEGSLERCAECGHTRAMHFGGLGRCTAVMHIVPHGPCACSRWRVAVDTLDAQCPLPFFTGLRPELRKPAHVCPKCGCSDGARCVVALEDGGTASCLPPGTFGAKLCSRCLSAPLGGTPAKGEAPPTWRPLPCAACGEPLEVRTDVEQPIYCATCELSQRQPTTQTEKQEA